MLKALLITWLNTLNNKMKLLMIVVVLCGSWLSIAYPTAHASDQTTQQLLSLHNAITHALDNDAWLTGSKYRHQSDIALSVVAGQLPDPVISLSAANLPLDTFDINQEQMTQAKIGISQSFPRGNTRSLTRRKYIERANRHVFMLQDRIARITRDVTLRWLDWYCAEQSIDILVENRSLFIELAEITRIGYASTKGKVRQDDVIRAQIELLRLDDQITQFLQQAENHMGALIEWFPLHDPISQQAFQISDQLPNLELLAPPEVISQQLPDETELTLLLNNHPSIRSIDQQIEVGLTDTKLARQKYKPAWSLNASYGYRDEDMFGRDRADFLTFGVILDLPIFTSKRQDKYVQSTDATLESIKTGRQLLQRSMLAGLEASASTFRRLNEREELYKQHLLIQISAQAEASLVAYTNDDGDFSDVVAARIEQITTQIEVLNITVDMLKAKAELNYFLTQSTKTPVVTPKGEQ